MADIFSGMITQVDDVSQSIESARRYLESCANMSQTQQKTLEQCLSKTSHLQEENQRILASLQRITTCETQMEGLRKQAREWEERYHGLLAQRSGEVQTVTGSAPMPTPKPSVMTPDPLSSVSNAVASVAGSTATAPGVPNSMQLPVPIPAKVASVVQPLVARHRPALESIRW